MDIANTAAGAVVGAVVAVAATVIVDHLSKAKDDRREALLVYGAEQTGYANGWRDGRESLIEHFSDQAVPQDFATR